MLTPAALLPFATALGWTLVHSLWQISLVYGLFWLLQHALSKHNVLIYNVSMLAMFLCAGWTIVTFQHEYTLTKPVEKTLALRPDMAPVLLDAPVSAPGRAALVFLEPAPVSFGLYIPYIGMAWSICVALLYLRLLGGFWVARRLRRRNTIAVTGDWQANCTRLATQLGIRRVVTLLESPRITEPLTLGFWKPVILFPAGLLLQLSPAQVEALLLHELAHIRRYDYVLNALQLLLEATFFYHPLFRLLARTARTRREYCCDDVVLQHCPNRLLYARTLTDLQLSLVHRKNQFVMNATGKNSFTTRILRIAGMQPAERRAPWLVLLLFVCTATGSVWSVLNAANTPRHFAEMILNQPALSKFAGDKQINNTLKINTITNISTQDSAAPAKSVHAELATIEIPPAQDSFPNNPVAAVAPLKMNVLYIGVDNPVNIAVGGYDCAALQVRIKGPGAITNIGDCQYNITATAPGQLVVQIYTMQGGKEKLLAENTFRIKRIPDAKPAFSNFYGGVITKAELQQLTTVNAMLQNFDFDAQCTVTDFSVTILPYRSSPLPEYQVPGTFPQTLLDNIHALQPGDAFFIDNIKVKCSGDAGVRDMGSMAFKIKE